SSQLAQSAGGLERLDLKRVVGGLLVQERDLAETRPEELRVVTERRPSEEEMRDLLFAWRVVRHVKSNAIVLAKGGQVGGRGAGGQRVGWGGGQGTRAERCALAVKRAGPRARGSVCASAAFSPFPDGPETRAQAGVTAITQPGGARHDAASIEVCNRYGVAM